MKRGITNDISLATLLSVLVFGALGSCGPAKQSENDSLSDDHAAAVTPQPPAADIPGQPAPDTAMTDANIEGVVIAANVIAIHNARLAQSTSNNDAVKTFAAQMVTDHTSVNAKVNEFAARAGITAHASDVSRRLTSDAEAKRSTLKGLPAGAIDKAYIG